MEVHMCAREGLIVNCTTSEVRDGYPMDVWVPSGAELEDLDHYAHVED